CCKNIQQVVSRALVGKRLVSRIQGLSFWLVEVELKKKACSCFIVTVKTTAAEVCSKLDALYMTKSLANKLYLKMLYTFYMPTGRKISEHIDEFNKIVLDLEDIEVKLEDEGLALLLLTSLPISYEHFVDTLLNGREALTLEDSRRKSRSKSRGGRLKCYIFQSEDHLKRNCPKNNPKSTCYVKKDDQFPSSSGSIYDSSEVMMVISVEALLDWIMDSGCSNHMLPRLSIDGAADDTIIEEDGKPSMDCDDLTRRMEAGACEDVLGGLNKDEQNAIMDVVMDLCGNFLVATSDNVYSPKGITNDGPTHSASEYNTATPLGTSLEPIQSLLEKFSADMSNLVEQPANVDIGYAPNPNMLIVHFARCLIEVRADAA
nr:retrovirus-related Pol polyprotein from transposon TNT 1-94 [Tanacetum cinerariifolium]